MALRIRRKTRANPNARGARGPWKRGSVGPFKLPQEAEELVAQSTAPSLDPVAIAAISSPLELTGGRSSSWEKRAAESFPRTRYAGSRFDPTHRSIPRGVLTSNGTERPDSAAFEEDHGATEQTRGRVGPRSEPTYASGSLGGARGCQLCGGWPPRPIRLRATTARPTAAAASARVMITRMST